MAKNAFVVIPPASDLDPDDVAAVVNANASGADYLTKKSYVDGLVTGLLDDRGNFDAHTNTWPSSGGSGTAGAILKGDVWRISVGGTLGGTVVVVGSTIRALVDTPGTTASNWAILAGEPGYVPENAANKSTSISLGTSDVNYPSQNAVQQYVDLNALLIAALPSNYYAASGLVVRKAFSVAADRYTVQTPTDGAILVNRALLTWSSLTNISLATAGNWDTVAPTDYTVAATRAGKDFYLYACSPVSGTTPVWKLSASSTYPSGYTADNSRKVGAFHCLCVAVNHTGTLTAWAADTVIAAGETRKATVWDGFIYRCSARAGDFKTHATDEPVWAGIDVGETIVDDQITWTKELHALEGYVAGDILPQSVSDHTLSWPIAGPEGMIKLPTRDRWIDIYPPSGTGASIASVYAGSISASRSPQLFLNDFLSVDKEMAPIDDFIIAVQGSTYAAIAGGGYPATAGGHADAYGRRMVSNVGVEDGTGGHDSYLLGIPSSGAVFLGGGAGGPYYANASIMWPYAGHVSQSSRGGCGRRPNGAVE
ncbi:MAG: hypothetical protein WC654_00725 [Patescibacteria group bacterium]